MENFILRIVRKNVKYIKKINDYILSYTLFFIQTVYKGSQLVSVCLVQDGSLNDQVL